MLKNLSFVKNFITLQKYFKLLKILTILAWNSPRLSLIYFLSRKKDTLRLSPQTLWI